MLHERFDQHIDKYLAARGTDDFDDRAAGHFVLDIICAGRRFLHDHATEECGVNDPGAAGRLDADRLDAFVLASARFAVTQSTQDGDARLAAARDLIGWAPLDSVMSRDDIRLTFGV